MQLWFGYLGRSYKTGAVGRGLKIWILGNVRPFYEYNFHGVRTRIKMEHIGSGKKNGKEKNHHKNRLRMGRLNLAVLVGMSFLLSAAFQYSW